MSSKPNIRKWLIAGDQKSNPYSPNCFYACAAGRQPAFVWTPTKKERTA